MPRFSPFVVEVRSALSTRSLAISEDPRDCTIVLERILARHRREVRRALDPLTAAALAAEADRVEKVLLLVRGALPPPRAKPAGAARGEQGASTDEAANRTKAGRP